MTKYFVSANLWLVVAFALYVGRTEHSDDPTYSVFTKDSAVYFSAQVYLLMNLATLVIATVLFCLAWKARDQS